MPGKGRRGLAKDEELNLVPIMNLVSILIPFLVMASAQVQLAVIDSTMPAISEERPEEEPEEDEDPPLQVNVVITDQGFSVRHNKSSTDEEDAVAVVVEEGEEEDGPTVPCVDQLGQPVTECMTVLVGSACDAATAAGQSCVQDNYHYAGLTEELANIKAEFGEPCPYIEGSPEYGNFNACDINLDESTLECDRNIIIAPESAVKYEVLIRAMDAARTESRTGNPSGGDLISGGGLRVRGAEERDLSSGEYNPERPQDARVDRVGHYVARKLCSENTETGERTTREEEIHNELFPFVVIAGGTAGASE